MEHTAQIELANQADRVAVELGVLNSQDVRRLTVEDALVDTGATGLCLPTPLIKQLGLTPHPKKQGHRQPPASLNASFTPMSTLRYFNAQENSKSLIYRKAHLSLLGHMVLEMLDLCVDIQKGLIYNPAHDGEWTIKILLNSPISMEK